jgi:ferredoxin
LVCGVSTDRANEERQAAMKIVLDRGKCTGLGICEAQAPSHFEIDDDGDLVILGDEVAADQLDEVKAAVQGCPTAALKLVEE